LVEEYLRKVLSMHQKDWDIRLPIFLLAYRALTQEITGMMPASMVFRRQLHLSCDLLFRASPNKELYITGSTHRGWVRKQKKAVCDGCGQPSGESPQPCHGK
jgi:hypothetical protein